jgi:hypothetical protein
VDLIKDDWGTAQFITPTTIIFDIGYTPATSKTLKLMLVEPLVKPVVSINPDSVLYLIYGSSTVPWITGSVALRSYALAVPESRHLLRSFLGFGLTVFGIYRAGYQRSEAEPGK